MDVFKRIILTMLVLALGVMNLRAADVLVECESFEEKGGWQVDQQFMDAMGSPYLIAHGLGKPVTDASTTVNFPEKGRYYVYVRTFNWTSPWKDGEGPGKFNIYVNGKKMKQTLGASGNAWEWQAAGNIFIKDQKGSVRLHDLTGFDGRCDAIYFTTVEGQLPPSDAAGLEAFRRKALSLPDEAPLAGEYDLVVVGAGIAGMSAAGAASRLGCKVALVNDRPVIGGNNSSEIRVHLGGKIEMEPYKELGGLQKEFGPVRGGNAQPAENYEDQKKMDWMRAEKNVTLYLNYRLVGVRKEGNEIASVIIKHVESGKEISLKGRLFSDCTGDGTLGYLAGADYRIGREGRDEFGESIAPEKPDRMTLGASVQWYSEDAGKPAEFPEFNYGITFSDESCEKVKMGEWTWETGMFDDQIHNFEKVRDYGLLVVYSNWSYLKNHLKDNAEYRNRELGWVAYLAGKRESRRLMGDYILSEDDIVKNVNHEDASFITTWSIDLHRPDPKNAADFPGKEFKAVTTHILIYPYAVPYRCLYSRNIGNLFMAGRDISVTHVALGTTRVMRTTGMMGEVVGMAASLCKKHGASPRQIYYYHLDELKGLMKEGVNRKGLPNNQTYNEGGSLKEKPTVR